MITAPSNPGTTEFSASAELRDRMVAAVVKIIKAYGYCEPNDVIAKGFTAGEVERHWALAYALAKTQLNMMDS